MATEYPIKRNLYIYSRNTAKGFLRMQRLGAPRPLFFVQDRLARVLKAFYAKVAKKLMADIKAKLSANGLTADAAADEGSLLAYFDELAKQGMERSADMASRANAGAVAASLESEWLGSEADELARLDAVYGGSVEKDFKPAVDRILKKDQKEYVARILAGADRRTKGVVAGFSIDKKKFFEDNLDEVRRLYVDNSVERIAGEVDWIKRQVLQRITDYATNKADALKFDDLYKTTYEKGDQMARLFARDQMARFNKACTIATYKNTGTKKVKWMATNDGRVRDKPTIDKQGRVHRAHTELNGMVFDIDNLPLEIDDYNCRCSLIPVDEDE